jgi:rRNA small subunit pseudouridine methyltransferase Nep1
MRALKNAEKRGRPDVIHQSLLLLLDSPASKDFEVFVHTINGEIIWVNSETRLPRNYNRFCGLMEDLFKKGTIKSGEKILLEITDLELRDVLGDREVVVLSENGVEDEGILIEAMRKNFAVCIGAFPHGDFSNDVISEMKNAKFVSLGKEAYTTLYVTSKFLCMYEGIQTP